MVREMRDEATCIVEARLAPQVGGATCEWRDDAGTTLGQDRLLLPERAPRRAGA